MRQRILDQIILQNGALSAVSSCEAIRNHPRILQELLMQVAHRPPTAGASSDSLEKEHSPLATSKAPSPMPAPLPSETSPAAPAAVEAQTPAPSPAVAPA